MVRHPVFTLLENGDFDGVRTLLTREPDAVSARDERGVSLLLFTLYYRRAELAELIEKKRQTLDLYEAAALGRVARIVEILDADPGSVAQPAGDGFTALHLAAFFGKAEAVSVLISRNADIFIVSDNPMKVAPINSAVAGRSLAAVSALIQAGADVDARQQEGYTPLMGAAAAGAESIARALLEAGADASLKSDNGQTAAEIAASHKHEKLASLLTGN